MEHTEHEPIIPFIKNECDKRIKKENILARGRQLIHYIFDVPGAQSVKLDPNDPKLLSDIYRSLRKIVNPELPHLPDDPSQGLKLVVQAMIEHGVAEELSESVINAEKQIRIKTENPNFSINGTFVDVLRRAVNNCLARERVTDRRAERRRRRSRRKNADGEKNHPRRAGNVYDFEE